MPELIRNKRVIHVLLILILSYLALMFGNGMISLTNPDEVFYMQTAKEMAHRSTWFTPYLFGEPQFEKPVFAYWLWRAGFFVFGDTSFGARFFPALFAIFGALTVYFLGILGFKNENKAFISSIILMTSGLYVGLARTVLIDMIFSVLILFSLAAFYWGYAVRQKRASGILLMFVFAGLAVLAKGPLWILIPVLAIAIFLALRKDLGFFKSFASLWGLVIFLLISMPWFVFMIKKFGHIFTHEFFYNDHWRRILEAEHKGNDTWYFYPLTMVGCMFPWSLYVAASLAVIFKKLKKDAPPIYLFLVSWVAAVFFIFQPAHSKLTSYIFPMFPALAVLAADYIYDAVSGERRGRALFYISLAVSLVPILAAVGAVFASGKFSMYIPSKTAVYAVSGVLAALSLLMLFLILRGKLLKGIMLVALLNPIFLSVIPFVASGVEPYVSSRDISGYLLNNYKVEGPIICSRMFVRGVRYYTGKDVAVMDIPGRDFFSPHPIFFLNSDDKVSAFLHERPVTFCVLKKSALEDLNRTIKKNKDLKAVLLKQLGSQYLMRIELLPKK